MAKIKLTKGKARYTKRNVFKTTTTVVTYLNLIACVFILLKLYGVIDVI